MKQDLNGVRTAQDLERKYDLSSISLIKKAVEQSEVGLTKVNKELENFANSTTKELENLQNQVDGNITTYYYSGVPTLSNLPASEWDEDKYNVHLGDLYYDKDTGYAYRFYLDSNSGVYGWTKLTDSDVTEALALANAANDTADSKRRVFVNQPTTPYDNGDLWIKDEELYVCQISKESGDFSQNDFIAATKYTDDTKANQVGDELIVFEGTVTQKLSDTEARLQVSEVAINNNYQEIIGKFDDYALGTDLAIVENSVTTLQTSTYTKTEIDTKLIDGSVTKVQTVSGTFDENGMHYEKTDAPTKSTINEKGLTVESTTGTGEELLFAGYDDSINSSIVRTANINVTNYLVIGSNSRMENYEDGTGVFDL